MKKRIIARLFIKNGSIDAFKEQAAIIIPKTRKEKGCLFYSLFQDVSNPGEFVFYEEYEDQTAVDCHLKSEYLQSFRESVSGMHLKEKIVEVI